MENKCRGTLVKEAQGKVVDQEGRHRVTKEYGKGGPQGLVVEKGYEDGSQKEGRRGTQRLGEGGEN